MHGIEDTISRGMCVGCGACSVATGGAVRVTLSRHRIYQADTSGATPEQVQAASAVCPFSDDAVNEDQLGAPHPAPSALHDRRVGSYSTIRAGRVADDGYLVGSSSGGLTSWLIVQLLERREVDAVVHVGRQEGDEMFGYQISTTVAELTGDRKSQYYATTMRDVLELVRNSSQRVALVGVPCFIKAARLLARSDDRIDSSIVYYIGLVCGHLKTQFFAEALAWQVGVAPSELNDVDFRVKNPARNSSAYDFAATAVDGKSRAEPTASLLGGSWGYGAFQPEACNFCDDIFAETADIVFGDAWLPQYKSDWRGTNVMVSRNARLDEILAEGADSGALVLEALSVDDAATSQGGNFRHRRQGLAVRLADDIARGESVPRKRVLPNLKAASRRRRRLIRQRRLMSRKSIEWFAEAREAGDFALFAKRFRAEADRYEKISRPWFRAVGRRVKAILKRG